MKDFAETNTISQAVLEMITVANEYCLFFEKAENYPTEEILNYFQKIGPLLYLKGTLLPQIATDDPGLGERFVTEEQWEQIFKVLRDKFGENDIYHTHDHNFDSVQASLSDNVADIYQDMKDFILLYQKNTETARQHAIAQCRDHFSWHWGPALLHALAAVHQLLYREQINPDVLNEETDWLL